MVEWVRLWLMAKAATIITTAATKPCRMRAFSCILSMICSPAALGKKTELWEYLRSHSPELYHKLKYRSISFVGNIPGYQGRKLSVKLYRLARKIYKFN